MISPDAPAQLSLANIINFSWIAAPQNTSAPPIIDRAMPAASPMAFSEGSAVVAYAGAR